MYIRNGLEHDSDGDPERMKKYKLGTKIMWLQKQLHEMKIEIYTDVNIDKLMNLPMANIQIMERQLESMYNTQKSEIKQKVRTIPKNVNIELGMPL
jgi:hypothetical protein